MYASTAALATEAQFNYLSAIKAAATVLSETIEDPQLLQNPEDDEIAPVVLDFLELASAPVLRQYFDRADAQIEAGILDPLVELVDKFISLRERLFHPTAAAEEVDELAPSTPIDTPASVTKADEPSPETASPPQKKRKRQPRKSEPEPVQTRSSRGGRSASTSEGGRLTRSSRGGSRK
jgi:hypothetical protein